mmetsp:Transcript_116631/g.302275  ORF Transcript_116631/g.302275 Transcript_116631/m.302275 type:complete len:215 (-) Transcript_116631:388-1032(-)
MRVSSVAPRVARSAARRVTAPAAVLRAAVEPPLVARSAKRRPTMPAAPASRSTATAAVAMLVPSPWQVACTVMDRLDSSIVSQAAQSWLADHGASEVVAGSREVATAEAAPTTLSAKLDSASAVETRASMCATLAEEALCGEAEAAVELAKMLCDSTSEVRIAAKESLLSLAPCAPESIVELVSDQLQLADTGLRWRSHEHSIVAAEFLAQSVK